MAKILSACDSDFNTLYFIIFPVVSLETASPVQC